jgi:N-hydroxyarylamine O-acetyltransferase
MNVEAYLQRIGVNGTDRPPSLLFLRELQWAHLLTVPFENLDIHWKRPITLDLDKFYSKIVDERRGGFCYELNGFFNTLLISLGFTTRLISARVCRPDGSAGPEYDHTAIIVFSDEGEFLVDVGFGDFVAHPLRFVVGEEQKDRTGSYRIESQEDGAFIVRKLDDNEWKGSYVFADTSRQLAEFTEMCDFQQYSPESHFTKGKLCSIMTENGRKTLTDRKFIVTAEGTKNEFDIESEQKFSELLMKEFAIERNI